MALVCLSTAGAVAGYLFLLWYARFYAPERELRVPRFHQALVLLALVLTGVVLGQLVRQVRRLASEYERRLAGRQGAQP